MEIAAKKIIILKQFANLLKHYKDDCSQKNKVYGVIRDCQNIFFDTKKDLKEYVKGNNLSTKDMFKVEYVGDYLEHDNVIKCTKNNEIFIYEIVDNAAYLVYGPDKGGKYRWQFKYGNITEYYKALDRYDIKKLIR